MSGRKSVKVSYKTRSTLNALSRGVHYRAHKPVGDGRVHGSGADARSQGWAKLNSPRGGRVRQGPWGKQGGNIKQRSSGAK